MTLMLLQFTKNETATKQLGQGITKRLLAGFEHYKSLTNRLRHALTRLIKLSECVNKLWIIKISLSSTAGQRYSDLQTASSPIYVHLRITLLAVGCHIPTIWCRQKAIKVRGRVRAQTMSVRSIEDHDMKRYLHLRKFTLTQ